jgi:hypothetical protein
MNDLTYQKLRRLFEDESSSDALALIQGCKSDERLRRRVIGTLARLSRKNKIKEGNAPLIILTSIDPELGDAVRAWTSGRFAAMRAAQEKEQGDYFDAVRRLESGLRHFPLWKKEVRHTSAHGPRWQEILSTGRLELTSFLSCSRLGYKTDYAFNITLVFRKLRSARLLGSLSAHHGEGEVLLPRGARFEVVERREAQVTLEEVGP